MRRLDLSVWLALVLVTPACGVTTTTEPGRRRASAADVLATEHHKPQAGQRRVPIRRGRGPGTFVNEVDVANQTGRLEQQPNLVFVLATTSTPTGPSTATAGSSTGPCGADSSRSPNQSPATTSLHPRRGRLLHLLRLPPTTPTTPGAGGLDTRSTTRSTLPAGVAARRPLGAPARSSTAMNTTTNGSLQRGREFVGTGGSSQYAFGALAAGSEPRISHNPGLIPALSKRRPTTDRPERRKEEEAGDAGWVRQEQARIRCVSGPSVRSGTCRLHS